ncbi:hypothetical protein Tco_0271260 [Tanacetum coccineum]
MKKSEEENQVESEEDVLYEGRNSDDERLTVGMEKKKKRTKKAKSSTSRSYMIKQSKNEIGGENNDSEEEQEDRTLTKDKMDEGLENPQKKCLKDMGFERMIHFPIVELPSALAYHAIDHFHPGSMELRLEKGSIKATRQKVQDMLGYDEKNVLKFDINIQTKDQGGGVVKSELFNDNEFKLYEYSKDDDSEGETDGDNEDNNHDDEGAPTADTN